MDALGIDELAANGPQNRPNLTAFDWHTCHTGWIIEVECHADLWRRSLECGHTAVVATAEFQQQGSGTCRGKRGQHAVYTTFESARSFGTEPMSPGSASDHSRIEVGRFERYRRCLLVNLRIQTTHHTC